ncbi:transcriptional regulator [Paenibacillus sp. IHB B 3084]|uniref:LysR family transcriptional regulator n=1 Tax=Paenibacillus sp. IHB B 3084 TaxID=867076 RepID=UPI0007202323|nr:LysR family transcriptional regulator [Paenibacillus sp. IHB B 3084]ALP36446.1 transcriptional regulator [Paenibacillus sp. IHB B 3084]
MDMKHLHYFCVIVEEGQITKAARTLNMAQPPLSQQLKNMEDELGVKLIYREGKKWEVTEAGYALYTRAKRLLAEMEDTCREIGEFENNVTGTLSIGTSSACMSLITEQLSRFHQDYPEVYVKIGHGDTHHLEELLHQNKVDLALLLLPVDDNSYHTIELEGVSFVAVLPCEWADRHSSGEITLQEAASYDLLLARRTEGHGLYETVIRKFQEHHLTPRVVLDCPEISTILALVSTGMGITIIPDTGLGQEYGDRIRTLSIKEPFPVTQPAVVWRKDRYLSNAARKLVEQLQAGDTKKTAPE